MYIQDIRVCAECEGSFDRSEMVFTRDCHGIPFRLVCWNCYNTVMETVGYDGEYYDDTDENLDYEY